MTIRICLPDGSEKILADRDEFKNFLATENPTEYLVEQGHERYIVQDGVIVLGTNPTEVIIFGVTLPNTPENSALADFTALALLLGVS